jgi:hypothetical protein
MFSRCCFKINTITEKNSITSIRLNTNSINENLIKDLVYDLNLRSTDEDQFNNILNKIVCFTSSEFGYIIKYDTDTDKIDELAVTNISWNEESRNIYAGCILKKNNLFTNKCSAYYDSIKYKAPMIYNKFDEIRKCSYENDHPPIHSFMSIPIMGEENNVICCIGLANRYNGYRQEDIMALKPIIDYLRKLFIDNSYPL